MLSRCNGRAVKSFDPDGGAVPSARAFAREIAHAWGIESEDTAFLIGLVVSELATNAVVHAHTPFTVALATENGAVTVEVSDNDPRLPALRAPAPMALNGRGLVLIDQVSRAWGTRPVPGGGKVVWAELRCPLLGSEEPPFPSFTVGQVDE
jgi:anti-sigma regulatory factor (Ser/Thr protein kinase)